MRKHLAAIAYIFLLTFVGNPSARSQWVYTNGPNFDGYPGIILCFGVSGSTILTGTESMTDISGTSLTTDYGSTWQEADNGMQFLPSNTIVAQDSNLFAGTPSGVFRSMNGGTNWIPSGNMNQIFSLAVGGTNIIAGTLNQGVFLSTDAGTNWTAIDSGMNPVYAVTSFAFMPKNLFAGTDGNGIFLTTNNGVSWAAVDSGLTNTNLLCLTPLGTNLFAGSKAGIFLSTNNGSSWALVDSGLTNTWIHALVASGSNLFAGTDGGVFLSTNNGLNWSEVDSGLTDIGVGALAVCGGYLFAGVTEGVWRRPLSEMIPSSTVAVQPIPSPSIQTYPNPLTQSTKISFTLPESGEAEVTIVNLLGSEVARLFSGTLGAGAHSFEWDAGQAAAGTYFCALRTINGGQRVALVVEK